MLDPSSNNLNSALDFARDFLAKTSKWAQDIGKPVVLEEVSYFWFSFIYPVVCLLI